jgi:hypothetical protein
LILAGCVPFCVLIDLHDSIIVTALYVPPGSSFRELGPGNTSKFGYFEGNGNLSYMGMAKNSTSSMPDYRTITYFEINFDL